MLAGIVVDNWKVPIFKEQLDKDEYEYTEELGPTPDTSILKVECTDIHKLKWVVQKSNNKAARSRAH